jgi:hypothetical protein
MSGVTMLGMLEVCCRRKVIRLRAFSVALDAASAEAIQTPIGRQFPARDAVMLRNLNMISSDEC